MSARGPHRLEKNAQSKMKADHDREPWSEDELDWLRSWDGTEAYLEELADLLGRTIEACRQQFYHRRRQQNWSMTTTVTTTTTTVTYRGWMEGMEED